MNQFSEEPILRNLASKVSVHGPSLEYRGAPAKGSKPNSGIHDAMLAFSQAHKQSPVGWSLFEVKYLELEERAGTLLYHVVKEIPGVPHRRGLGELVIQCFCTGTRLSKRGIRRRLGVDRGVAGGYYEHALNTLDWLRATEQEFARLVRQGM